MTYESKLPGLLLNVAILSAIVTLVASLAIIASYRRAVRRGMKGAPKQKTENDSGGPKAYLTGRSYLRSLETVSSPLFGYARTRLREIAAVYSAAGFACACVLTTSFLLEARVSSVRAGLVFLLVFSWPVLLCWNDVAEWGIGAPRRNALAYAAGLAGLGLAGLVAGRSGGVETVAAAFLLVDVAATLAMLMVLNSLVRSVAPCVILLAMFPAAGFLAVPYVVSGYPDAVVWWSDVTGRMGLSVVASVLTLYPLGIAALLPIGWLAVRFLVRRYRLRRMSEQSLQIDMLWLLYCFFQGLILVTPNEGSSGEGRWVAPFAFPVYVAVRVLGFRILRDKVGAPKDLRMLYLRRFALQGKTARFFGAATRAWRVVGDVSLIGGTDLARTTIQPHTLLHFLGGRLRDAFIGGDEELKRQFAQQRRSVDPDTRFRVTDYFCRDSMWQRAVTELMKKSDAILADFRGATAENKGSLFEIQQLLSTVPLARVVMVTDTAKVTEYLTEAIDEFALSIPADTPNYLTREALPPFVVQVESAKQELAAIKVLFAIAQGRTD